MPSSKYFIVKTMQRTLRFFDLYGQTINFFIKKKTQFYSAFSGLIRIGVIVIIIFTFTGFISSWVNKEKMIVIPSSISYSVGELLTKNESYEYQFDYKNYYIYWVIAADFPDGTSLVTEELKNYFSYSIRYTSELGIDQELFTEPCKTDQMDEFIGLDEAVIKKDMGNTNDYRICIKNGFKMGLFPDNKTSMVYYPSFTFQIYQCVNSTKNNYSCATEEAIDEIIKYSYVQTTIPTTAFDFNNIKKPQKNNYDYKITYFDKSIRKRYINDMTTTKLYTDYGLISDDYRVESTNFNPKIDYDPYIRQSVDDPLFQFTCNVGFNFQFYYLRNLKLNEVIGSLGGLINAVVLLGKFFSLTYNSINLRMEIIKSTFSKSNSKAAFPKNIFDSQKTISAKILRSFSYCANLFPSKEVRTFYQKGSQNLHEYLDIRNVIKRLQDLDKLKMILLDEDQRRIFELIPKPAIVDSKNMLSLKSINKYKETKSKGLRKKLSKSLAFIDENDDTVNKRIFELIDPKLKNKFQYFDKDDYEGLFYKIYVILKMF